MFSLLTPGASVFAAETELSDLCVDDVVYSPDGQWRGTVKAIYGDGTVGVQYPGSSNPNEWYRQRSFILGRTKGRIRGISVGDGFETNSGRSGHIKAVYLNGSYCARFDDDADDDSNNGIYHREDFSRSWGLRDDRGGRNGSGGNGSSMRACTSIHGFKVGDGVFNSTGVHGTITALDCGGDKITVSYSDGTIVAEYYTAIGHDNGCIEIHSCVRRMSYINQDLEPANRLMNVRFNESNTKSQIPDSLLDQDTKAPATTTLLAI